MTVPFSVLKKAALASLEHPGQAKPLPKNEKPGYSHLYLCRHAQTYDNIRRIFSGRRNSNLTPEGKQQALHLAQRLKNKHFDLFIISPLKRCLETVSPLCYSHPQTPLLKEKRLLERDYGQLTGTSKRKLMKQKPRLAVLYRRSYDFPPPGGESLKTVKQRVWPFCHWLKRFLKEKQRNVLVCCTNNTMRLIRQFYEKLPLSKMLTLENRYADYAVYSIPVTKKK